MPRPRILVTLVPSVMLVRLAPLAKALTLPNADNAVAGGDAGQSAAESERIITDTGDAVSDDIVSGLALPDIAAAA